MNLIEILDTSKNNEHKSNVFTFLNVEKFMVQKHFDWISLSIKKKFIHGKAILRPKGCSNSYQIEIYYSPFLWNEIDKRYDRIYIRKPNVKFNPKIHMYGDKSLCLYYPNDYIGYVPLYKILFWISEWLIKYEFYKRFGTWIGNEVEHK
ncbi:hypothetical protein PL371_02615 [Tenacibaculum maritimum]|nr:hypothetical protein [Tenacibaculum maritimum]MDB0610780.1 hypothetical protein [Tenacibaculum maritimum]